MYKLRVVNTGLATLNLPLRHTVIAAVAGRPAFLHGGFGVLHCAARAAQRGIQRTGHHAHRH